VRIASLVWVPMGLVSARGVFFGEKHRKNGAFLNFLAQKNDS
jgi:hypothetical protein